MLNNTNLMQLMQEEKMEKETEAIELAVASNTKTSFSSSQDFPSNSLQMVNNHGTSSSFRVSSRNSSRINPLGEEFDEDCNNVGGSINDDVKVDIAVAEGPEKEAEGGESGVNGGRDIEAWLPITESRKGNLWSCIFLLVSSGIGVQSLALPFAFAVLGWGWAITWMSIAFIWQLYTLWLLVHLHEAKSGHRYSRYLQLAMTTFGPKLGKLLGLFPIMYLSGGTCVMLLIVGGAAMQNLHNVLCTDGLICATKSLTTVEWYLVFICLAITIAQHPNLNSVAWVSLVSAITALVYCSLLWFIPVSEIRHSSTENSPLYKVPETEMTRIVTVLSAVGIISFSFRGHNLVVEIQGTLPASEKDPIHRRMWRGVTISYALIALCLFPVAIGGYWAYGTLMPKEGMLYAFGKFYGNNSAKLSLAVIYFFLIVNSLCTFPIYAMPVFDNLELRYMSIRKKPCTWWIRVALRLFFGGLAFFISVAVPFLPVLAPLISGIALPVTYAYPCFMWNSIKKPKRFGSMWWLNLVLGSLGILLSVLLVFAAISHLVKTGITANFFHPKP